MKALNAQGAMGLPPCVASHTPDKLMLQKHYTQQLKNKKETRQTAAVNLIVIDCFCIVIVLIYTFKYNSTADQSAVQKYKIVSNSSYCVKSQ